VENSNLLSKLWLLVPAGRETEISDFLRVFSVQIDKNAPQTHSRGLGDILQDCFFNMLNQTSNIELLSIHRYRRILNASHVGLFAVIV